MWAYMPFFNIMIPGSCEHEMHSNPSESFVVLIWDARWIVKRLRPLFFAESTSYIYSCIGASSSRRFKVLPVLVIIQVVIPSKRNVMTFSSTCIITDTSPQFLFLRKKFKGLYMESCLKERIKSSSPAHTWMSWKAKMNPLVPSRVEFSSSLWSPQQEPSLYNNIWFWVVNKVAAPATGSSQNIFRGFFPFSYIRDAARSGSFARINSPEKSFALFFSSSYFYTSSLSDPTFRSSQA